MPSEVETCFIRSKGAKHKHTADGKRRNLDSPPLRLHQNRHQKLSFQKHTIIITIKENVEDILECLDVSEQRQRAALTAVSGLIGSITAVIHRVALPPEGDTLISAAAELLVAENRTTTRKKKKKKADDLT